MVGPRLAHVRRFVGCPILSAVCEGWGFFAFVGADYGRPAPDACQAFRRVPHPKRCLRRVGIFRLCLRGGGVHPRPRRDERPAFPGFSLITRHSSLSLYSSLVAASYTHLNLKNPRFYATLIPETKRSMRAAKQHIGPRPEFPNQKPPCRPISNRPLPRLETIVTHTKQRSGPASNRP